MDDLVQFLRDRLDEDEQTAARAAGISSDTPASPRWYALLESVKRGWELFTDQRRLVASPLNEFDARHAARHDPARVLAEVDARRQIVDLHGPLHVQGDPITGCTTCSWRDEMDDLHVEWPCPTLRLLGVPDADHPDYREEWRPNA
ncbi:DUF6221 family protein [Streptomyces xanthophaeus]|uniref:DUF6221 family protein n=1 Tax=Streptomyces xanthophaeus TaxID=67385 RepID=UPI003652431A